MVDATGFSCVAVSLEYVQSGHVEAQVTIRVMILRHQLGRDLSFGKPVVRAGLQRILEPGPYKSVQFHCCSRHDVAATVGASHSQLLMSHSVVQALASCLLPCIRVS